MKIDFDTALAESPKNPRCGFDSKELPTFVVYNSGEAPVPFLETAMSLGLLYGVPEGRRGEVANRLVEEVLRETEADPQNCTTTPIQGGKIQSNVSLKIKVPSLPQSHAWGRVGGDCTTYESVYQEVCDFLLLTPWELAHDSAYDLANHLLNTRANLANGGDGPVYFRARKKQEESTETSTSGEGTQDQLTVLKRLGRYYDGLAHVTRSVEQSVYNLSHLVRKLSVLRAQAEVFAQLVEPTATHDPNGDLASVASALRNDLDAALPGPQCGIHSWCSLARMVQREGVVGKLLRTRHGAQHLKDLAWLRNNIREELAALGKEGRGGAPAMPRDREVQAGRLRALLDNTVARWCSIERRFVAAMVVRPELATALDAELKAAFSAVGPSQETCTQDYPLAYWLSLGQVLATAEASVLYGATVVRQLAEVMTPDVNQRVGGDWRRPHGYSLFWEVRELAARVVGYQGIRALDEPSTEDGDPLDKADIVGHWYDSGASLKNEIKDAVNRVKLVKGVLEVPNQINSKGLLGLALKGPATALGFLGCAMSALQVARDAQQGDATAFLKDFIALGKDTTKAAAKSAVEAAVESAMKRATMGARTAAARELVAKQTAARVANGMSWCGRVVGVSGIVSGVWSGYEAISEKNALKFTAGCFDVIASATFWALGLSSPVGWALSLTATVLKIADDSFFGENWEFKTRRETDVERIRRCVSAFGMHLGNGAADWFLQIQQDKSKNLAKALAGLSNPYCALLKAQWSVFDAKSDKFQFSPEGKPDVDDKRVALKNWLTTVVGGYQAGLLVPSCGGPSIVSLPASVQPQPVGRKFQ